MQELEDFAAQDSEFQQLRQLEAVIFAAAEPLGRAAIAGYMPDGCDLDSLLESLTKTYESRGIHLVCVAGKYSFRTAPDLAAQLKTERTEVRKLSRAALETLAIIAYHQPVTRAEVEEIRGVGFNRGTVDALLELGWARIGPRRNAPGRPVTYLTTDSFLSHFGLASVADLPGVEELKATGLLDARPLLPNFRELEGNLLDSDYEEDEEDDAQDRLQLEE